MICRQCGFENPAGVNFCGRCGSRLGNLCPACGFENPADFSFCGGCGRKLTEPSPSAEERMPPGYAAEDLNQKIQSYTPRHLAEKILSSKSAIEGERKIVTVLFADVSGFTSISERLDPEEVHSMMNRCFEILMDSVHRYEGSVNQFTGDGIMALFGAPISHEDGPRRAVHAALSMQEALGAYGEELKCERGIAFGVRIGLNTGPVVVGSIGNNLRMDYTAVGDTTNLAARMESLASPGTILVSENSYQKVKEYFEFEPVGELEVKGREEKVSAYRVTGVKSIRADLSEERRLTRLVGRARELDTLRDCKEKVKSGRGQLVCLVGEAGVGKSRLLYEFRKSLTGEDTGYLEGRCVSYGSSVAYLPWIELLKREFQVEERDREENIRHKVERKLDGIGGDLRWASPFLLNLFSVSLEGEGAELLRSLEPLERRRRTFEAIRAVVLKECQVRPLVMVLENLHWIDKTSEELLKFLVDSIAGSSMMVLVTFRPGYACECAGKSYFNQIAVDRLSEGECNEIIENILETERVSEEVRRLILAKAEGNPFYIEEITKSLVESGAVAKDLTYRGADALTRMEVPGTIQEVISARIDHLEGEVKRTLQEASVFGRDFSLPLLQRVSVEKEKLEQHVKELEGAEFIYEKSHFPEPIYSFKHAFIQEVAYGGLLLKRRRELHRAVASAIGELYPERLEENWGILAHHYYYGEAWESALEFQGRAGNKAKEVYANEEAAECYRRAIGAFGKLSPEGKAKKTGFIIQAREGLSSVYFFTAEYERSIRENEVLLALLEEEDPARRKWPLEWARAKARVGLAHERRGKFEDGLRKLLEAKEVLEAFPGGESSVEMSRCLGLLGWIHFRQHDCQEARRWAYESLRLAEELGSLSDITRAHNVLGASFVREGDYEKATGHFEKCLESEEALEHLPGMASSLYNLGLVACLRGSYGEAVEYYQKALDIRRQVGDALGTGTSLNSLGNVYHCLNQLDKAVDCYQESLKFREEIKHTEGVAVTLENLGRALTEKGEHGEAVKVLRRSLEVGEQIQAPARMSEAYLSLACALAATGEYEEARICAEESARKKCGDGGMDDEIRGILERLQDASLKDLSKEKLIRDRRSLHAWV